MIDPDRIYRNLVECGETWANNVESAELLESSLKSVKAQYALDAKAAEGCSMTEAEQIAISSANYRDHAAAAIKARTAANIAKVRYDAAKALFEARRSLEASERAANRAAT